jgi:dihydroneopterin aldolase
LDTIIIEGLAIETVIGIHAWEQQMPRPMRFDLELGFDIREAAASDQIRDAVDYHAVSQALMALTQARQFRLIEALAEAAARMIFEQFPISTLRMTIGKPGAVPEAKTVAVRIERRREDYARCGL